MSSPVDHLRLTEDGNLRAAVMEAAELSPVDGALVGGHGCHAAPHGATDAELDKAAEELLAPHVGVETVGEVQPASTEEFVGVQPFGPMGIGARPEGPRLTVQAHVHEGQQQVLVALLTAGSAANCAGSTDILVAPINCAVVGAAAQGSGVVPIPLVLPQTNASAPAVTTTDAAVMALPLQHSPHLSSSVAGQGPGPLRVAEAGVDVDEQAHVLAAAEMDAIVHGGHQHKGPTVPAPLVKLCRICNETKVAGDFYPSRCTANGLYYYCKACSREKSRQFVRSKERVTHPKVASKRCAKCGETKGCEQFNRYERSSVGLHSYCKDCSRKDSKTRRERLPPVAEPTVLSQVCSVCKEVKATEEFTRDRTRRTGLSHRCRVCKLQQNAKCHERRATQPVVIPATKVCSACNEEKPSSAYWKRPTSTDGLRSECKACSRDRYRQWVDKSLPNTTKPPMEAKVCKSCGMQKPALEFHRNRSSADGLESCCAACRAAGRASATSGGATALAAASKACVKCGEVKAAAEFKRNSAMPDGLVKSCKECSQGSRKRREAEPEHEASPGSPSATLLCPGCYLARPLAFFPPNAAAGGAAPLPCFDCIRASVPQLALGSDRAARVGADADGATRCCGCGEFHGDGRFQPRADGSGTLDWFCSKCTTHHSFKRHRTAGGALATAAAELCLATGQGGSAAVPLHAPLAYPAASHGTHYDAGGVAFVHGLAPLSVRMPYLSAPTPPTTELPAARSEALPHAYVNLGGGIFAAGRTPQGGILRNEATAAAVGTNSGGATAAAAGTQGGGAVAERDTGVMGAAAAAERGCGKARTGPGADTREHECQFGVQLQQLSASGLAAGGVRQLRSGGVARG